MNTTKFNQLGSVYAIEALFLEFSTPETNKTLWCKIKKPLSDTLLSKIQLLYVKCQNVINNL